MSVTNQLSGFLIQAVLTKGDQNEAFFKRVDQRHSSVCFHVGNVCVE